eukprot:1161936-Pelagomonas_calceolata.AAC.4
MRETGRGSLPIGQLQVALASKTRRTTTQALKTLPTSIKERRIPAAEALRIPSTKRRKKKEITSSNREGGKKLFCVQC